MVNIHAGAGIPGAVDLIESLNGGVPWMREWDFFEICRVPFGIAMENTHALAQKDILEPDDLRGHDVASFRDAAYEGSSELYRTLEGVGAKLKLMDAPSPSAFWECAFQHRLLLAPMCWSDILVGLTLRPVRWDYALPYGIFSRTATRDVAAAFLNFIHKTYTGDNPDDIVPVLSY